MIALLLRGLRGGKRCEFCAAHEHMRLSRSRIHINELTAIQISEMKAIRRPGQSAGRSSDDRSVRKNIFNGQRFCGGLTDERRNCGRNSKQGREQVDNETLQEGFLQGQTKRRSKGEQLTTGFPV